MTKKTANKRHFSLWKTDNFAKSGVFAAFKGLHSQRMSENERERGAVLENNQWCAGQICAGQICGTRFTPENGSLGPAFATSKQWVDPAM